MSLMLPPNSEMLYGVNFQRGVQSAVDKATPVYTMVEERRKSFLDHDKTTTMGRKDC